MILWRENAMQFRFYVHSRVSHKYTFLDFSLPLFTIVDHWARKCTGKILDFSDFGNLPPRDLEIWAARKGSLTWGKK